MEHATPTTVHLPDPFRHVRVVLDRDPEVLAEAGLTTDERGRTRFVATLEVTLGEGDEVDEILVADLRPAADEAGDADAGIGPENYIG